MGTTGAWTAVKWIAGTLAAKKVLVDMPKDAKDVARKAREDIEGKTREAEERAKRSGLDVEAARRQKTEDELRRRGRRASILTSAKGVQDSLGIVNRPEAKMATKLGGTFEQ